jgi:hypothetical protein
MAVMPAFDRLRQENHEFKATLGYTGRPYLKKKKEEEEEEERKMPGTCGSLL